MRLIDADAFREDLKTERENVYYNGILGNQRDPDEIDRFIDRLDEQPTIEADPVRRGEWMYNDMYLPNCAECSECGWKSSVSGDEISSYHYCPNCGAKMDGGNA